MSVVHEIKYRHHLESVGSGIGLFIQAFFIRLIWNIVVVPVLEVTAITYWQALGLRVLTWLLLSQTQDCANLCWRLDRILTAMREKKEK